MSTKIGRFEIVSEISKSASSAVYKANDPDAGRIIALKTIHVELPPAQARILEEVIQGEADSTKALNSQNIAALYGAGEIDGKFCAGMEYVEGNSLANMIARQEGFSIWDLLDITRQVCLAFDHANSHGVTHRSLEPGKVMMQWDGTVKVLGYGSSTLVSSLPKKDQPVPLLHYYMSPEQVKGEDLDIRSNIYSWGAILYEMVTDRKPFAGEVIAAVQQRIREETPEPPAAINPRMNLGVSRVIMRALSKNPEERYASGQELVEDLDKAKQTTQAAAAKQAGTPARGLVAPQKVKASAPSAPSVPVPTPTAPEAGARKIPVTRMPLPDPAAAASELNGKMKATTAKPAIAADSPASAVLNAAGEPLESGGRKAAAAAASLGGTARSMPGTAVAEKATGGREIAASSPAAKTSAKAPAARKTSAAETMSAATAERPAAEGHALSVDPMMADPAASSSTKSFSDLEEMPPMKQEDLAPRERRPAKPVAEEPAVATFSQLARAREPEKPKVITRENARKAVSEIKKVPPKLVMYAIGGAVAVILMIVGGIALRIHSQNPEEERLATTAMPTATAPPTQSEPASIPPAPVATPEPEVTPEHEVTVKSRPAARTRKTVVSAPARPVIVPGELAINSTPEGAQIQVDGRTDPSWVTPYSMAGLEPGPHAITIRKAGYSSEARNVEVASGSKSFLVVHLTQLGAMVTVTSSPAGASIFIDGRDSGRVTPAQVVTDRGSHTLLVRKQGYLDETMTAELTAGQTFNFSPILKPMGITDDIKTVGKFNKFFSGESTAGMGKVSVKTQPKGAQITVNRRMVDRPSPVSFALNPGSYVVDITLSGYKPIQKVITVEKSSKIEIDETLQPQP